MARRLIALLCTIALAAPLAGCWVVDEIDKGSKLMEQHSAVQNKKKKEESAEAAAAPAVPAGSRHAVDDYFRNEEEDGTTKTFSPGTMSKDIVSCKVGGSVQFMKREQCAARGGSTS